MGLEDKKAIVCVHMYKTYEPISPCFAQIKNFISWSTETSQNNLVFNGLRLGTSKNVLYNFFYIFNIYLYIYIYRDIILIAFQ